MPKKIRKAVARQCRNKSATDCAGGFVPAVNYASAARMTMPLTPMKE